MTRKYRQRDAEWRMLQYIVGRPISIAKKVKRPDGYTQLPLQLSTGYPHDIHSPSPEVDGDLSPEN